MFSVYDVETGLSSLLPEDPESTTHPHLDRQCTIGRGDCSLGVALTEVTQEEQDERVADGVKASCMTSYVYS